MPRDFFDPAPEQWSVILVDAATLRKAQRRVAGCEACTENAEIPFDNTLDRLTDCDPSVGNALFRKTPERHFFGSRKRGFGSPTTDFQQPKKLKIG